MKLLLKVLVEKEVKSVKISVPVNYGEEDIPNDFPFRNGDMWEAEIDIETGSVKDWPIGKSGDLKMKVVDMGTYTLLDEKGEEVAKIENDYVPNELIPGRFGDYVDLSIDENGKVKNWYDNPELTDFENYEH